MASSTQPVWQYREPGVYLALVRRIETALAAGERVHLHWCGPDLDRAGWRLEFGRALDARINLKAGPPPTWRKLASQYQTELYRDQQTLRDITLRRIRHYQFATDEVRRRYGHLLARYDD